MVCGANLLRISIQRQIFWRVKLKISWLTAASAPGVSWKYWWADGEFQVKPESSKDITATVEDKMKLRKMRLQQAGGSCTQNSQDGTLKRFLESEFHSSSPSSYSYRNGQRPVCKLILMLAACSLFVISFTLAKFVHPKLLCCVTYAMVIGYWMVH